MKGVDGPARKGPDLAALADGIRTGDRGQLARAITLVESRRPADEDAAQRLLEELAPETGHAIRVGITGVPGVGKSSFLERWGTGLVQSGKRLAVLAVDPSSNRTGGSILGDKTRMAQLSRLEGAFIRPSPGGDTPGGVARRTREAGLLCEAAGFDVVAVETIGVGQSETAVADMVDTFVLLLLAHGGDELQGIKRGVMELADVVVIHKADGEQVAAANRAAVEFSQAIRLLRSGDPWTVPVLTASSVTGEGIDDVWARMQDHRAFLETHVDHGLTALESHRRAQALRWFDTTLKDLIVRATLERPEVAAALPDLRRQVGEGVLPATAAARRVLGG